MQLEFPGFGYRYSFIGIPRVYKLATLLLAHPPVVSGRKGAVRYWGRGQNPVELILVVRGLHDDRGRRERLWAQHWPGDTAAQQERDKAATECPHTF